LTEKENEMPIPTPRISPFEINLNTIVVLAGFVSGFVAWGWTLNELQTGRAINAGNIEKLEARLAAVETTARRLDTHELRLAAVEKQAVDAATSMRALDVTLSALTHRCARGEGNSPAA
jgi:hypothetical protein